MSGETQQQDETEGDGRAWTPPPPHETPETLGDRYSCAHVLRAKRASDSKTLGKQETHPLL